MNIALRALNDVCCSNYIAEPSKPGFPLSAIQYNLKRVSNTTAANVLHEANTLFIRRGQTSLLGVTLGNFNYVCKAMSLILRHLINA